MTVSVIIITLNEADCIGRCLDSVSWADEIIVVDSGSTDGTVEICHARHVRVTTSTEWPGFGPQKNRALALATGEWVLSIDADEWLPPALQDEIRANLAVAPDVAAFRMPRLSSYCGRFLRHGGWWPDYVTRIFRRGLAHFSGDLVHERLVVNGRIATLNEPLHHEAFVSLEEVLEKVNRYSSLGALELQGARKRSSLTRAIGHGAWAFVRTYFIRAGFLDGRMGLMLAISNAEGTYYRYAKRLLQADGKPWLR